MMKKKDPYSSLMDTLKRQEPVLQDREGLEERIMGRIGPSGNRGALPGKVGNYVFSWVEYGWIRRTMAAAAAILTGIFIFQQVSVTRRINDLEERLITTASEIHHAEPGMGIMQKAFLNLVIREQSAGDSITVSRADMEELLESYMELRADYDILKEYLGPGIIPEDLNREDPGNRDKKEQPERNL